MNEILTSDWFQVIGVTLISIGLGVFLKYVTRNDKHASFKKDDLAIGLELMATALIILITDAVQDFNKIQDLQIPEKEKLQESLQIMPWIITIFLICLWTTSTVVRKVGWKSEDELESGWGVFFPNIIGITALVMVFIWVRN